LQAVGVTTIDEFDKILSAKDEDIVENLRDFNQRVTQKKAEFYGIGADAIAVDVAIRLAKRLPTKFAFIPKLRPELARALEEILVAKRRKP
jgi:hypothetical protein